MLRGGYLKAIGDGRRALHGFAAFPDTSFSALRPGQGRRLQILGVASLLLVVILPLLFGVVGGVLSLVLLVVAAKLVTRGRSLRTPSAVDLMRIDPRPPLLFLAVLRRRRPAGSNTPHGAFRGLLPAPV